MRWLVEQATAHVRQEEGVMMAQMRGGDDHDKTKRDTTLVEMEEKRWEEKVIAGTMRAGKWEKRKDRRKIIKCPDTISTATRSDRTSKCELLNEAILRHSSLYSLYE